MGIGVNNSFHVGSSGSSGSANDKGYFATLLALQTAYPTGQNGWFAVIGATDTIWVWDSGTNAWVNSGVSGGGGAWGSITGTLSNQADLNTALNNKENTITQGSTSQYYRGDKTWQTLNNNAVGLSNVPNTDATDLANDTIQGTFTPNNSAIVSGDDGKTIAEKTQGQIDDIVNNQITNKQDLITSPTNDNIVTTDVNGQTKDSGKAFGNDGTANTVPNSLQVLTQTNQLITQGLLNIPDLKVVQCASTANVATKSGLIAIDGYTLMAGNIVLLKNQTDGDNGFWIASASAWTRAKFDTTTKTFIAITTETKYSELNINNGVVNIANGTVNKNSQFQISVLRPNDTFGSSSSSNPAVTVTATTKLPATNNNNRYVSISQGNDTTNNGTESFPYATQTKALTGAQYPLNIEVDCSGGTLTENVTLTSGMSNVAISSKDKSTDAGKSQITGNYTFASNNTRVSLVGLTINSGANPPIDIGKGNLLRHKFENLILITTHPDLIRFDPSPSISVSNWFNIRNWDVGSSLASSIPLYDSAVSLTINIFNQTRRLPFTLPAGHTGVNWKINLWNCGIGAVIIPTGFAGTVNYYDIRKVNEVITTQARLTQVLADTTLNGYYLISGFIPTSFEKGCVFGKQSAGGGTENWLERSYNYENASIYDYNTKKTYIQENGDWAIVTSVAGGSTVVLRDSDANFEANNIIQNVTTFTASGNITIATGRNIVCNSATPITLTVNIATPKAGLSYKIHNIGAGQVTVVDTNNNTIDIIVQNYLSNISYINNNWSPDKMFVLASSNINTYKVMNGGFPYWAQLASLRPYFNKFQGGGIDYAVYSGTTVNHFAFSEGFYEIRCDIGQLTGDYNQASPSFRFVMKDATTNAENTTNCSISPKNTYIINVGNYINYTFTIKVPSGTTLNLYPAFRVENATPSFYIEPDNLQIAVKKVN